MALELHPSLTPLGVPGRPNERSALSIRSAPLLRGLEKSNAEDPKNFKAAAALRFSSSVIQRVLWVAGWASSNNP